MKYYYEKHENWVGAGETYICDHPMYNRCTLFRDGELGIAVIQEHFDISRKTRWWGSLEPWIAGDIYTNSNFQKFFQENAKPKNPQGLYPTFTVRKIMWTLRMKPLRREFWENEI